MVIKNNFLYVPVLQTKRGEFTALSELNDDIKNHIKPMLFLTKDKCEARSTSLGKNISSKWGNRPIYIDLTRAPDFSINGQYFINFIFNDFLSKQIDFTPVIDIENPNQSIISFVINHKIKACIKIDVQLFNSNTIQNLERLIDDLKASTSEIDVFIDFGANVKPTRQAQAQNISNYFFAISQQSYANIANIVIGGSSIPKDFLRSDYQPYGFEPRIEWLGFDDFMTTNSSTMQKQPIFSDYSTSYPNEQEPIDYVNPNAKIRYTISDSYMFAIGYQVHTHADGFDQYYAMSALLVNSPYFIGPHLSWGDKYIDDCSNKRVGCGNMETWVKVGHNHHITFVTHQIANQYGLSI